MSDLAQAIKEDLAELDKYDAEQKELIPIKKYIRLWVKYNKDDAKALFLMLILMSIFFTVLPDIFQCFMILSAIICLGVYLYKKITKAYNKLFDKIADIEE